MTLEEAQLRIERLEALVKKHLPCPHSRTEKSFDAVKDLYCLDCEEDIFERDVDKSIPNWRTSE